MIELVDPRTLDVDGRRWPVAEVKHHDVEGPDGMSMLHRFRGAAIAFESGWTVSVLWGTGTYSDNHGIWPGRPEDEFTETPAAVEVGVIHIDGGLVADPFSYVDGDDLNALLDTVTTWSSDPDRGTRFCQALHDPGAWRR